MVQTIMEVGRVGLSNLHEVGGQLRTVSVITAYQDVPGYTILGHRRCVSEAWLYDPGTLPDPLQFAIKTVKK